MMKLLWAVVLLALAGCATVYQPAGATGGFSETQRGDNIYLVRFEGNGYTKAAQVEDMVLLRAAELTIAKGFTFFAILHEDASSRPITITMPGSTTTTGRVDSFGNFRAQSYSSPGISTTKSAPTARLLVTLAGNNSVPGYSWINARNVAAELGPKYRPK
jgi:uncharacterized protein YceK